MLDIPPGFPQALSRLNGDQMPRVWSLVVTILGDLAQARGAELSGSALAGLTELVGVKPEAVRVAVHRLRKEGWIDSTRRGRAAFYLLTDRGRRESAAVSPRIYGGPPRAPERWQVVIAESTDAGAKATLDALAQRAEHAIALGGQGLLISGLRGPIPSGVFAAQTGAVDLPDWVKAQIGPEALLQEAAELNARFGEVAHAIEGRVLSLLESTALRMLVVHSWRRLVLRHPNLPAEFFPDGWQGAACREGAHHLMQLLPAPDPRALDF